MDWSAVDGVEPDQSVNQWGRPNRPIRSADEASFFRYRGRLYDVGEAMSITGGDAAGKWSGYYDETFFSRILIRFIDDDHVIVGVDIAD